MTTLLSNFSLKVHWLCIFFFTFEEYGGLERVEGSTLQATDLRDYTSYYCTCHLFSLALGMFAMVTAHSGLSGLTHAVLCISQHGCDEGKSLPMIPNPWWGGFSISALGPAWASLPASVLLCQPPLTTPTPNSTTKGIPSLNKQLFFFRAKLYEITWSVPPALWGRQSLRMLYIIFWRTSLMFWYLEYTYMFSRLSKMPVDTTQKLLFKQTINWKFLLKKKIRKSASGGGKSQNLKNTEILLYLFYLINNKQHFSCWAQ